MYKRQAPEEKAPQKRGLGTSVASKVSGTGENFVITVDGRSYNVTVKEGSSEVASVTEAPAAKTSSVKEEDSPDVVAVTASVPGNVYKVVVGAGDKVKENQTLIMLEAMKMETPVASPCDGEVVSIEVEQGQVVETGQLILTILPS